MKLKSLYSQALFFFLMVGLCFTLSAVYAVSSAFQSQNPDSLYWKAIRSTDLSVGIKLAKQACKTAQSQNNKITVLRSLNLIAQCFWERGLNDSAAVYGQRSLATATFYKIETTKADTWIILGLIDYSKGAYEMAINKYKNGIVLYQKQILPLNIAIAYKNIGICESELSRNTEAITYFLMGVKIFEAQKDNNNLASSYNAIALCFTALKDYPKALGYHQESLKIRKKLRNNKAIAQSFNNIGFTFKEFGQPDSAIAYLSKSISLYLKEPDSSLLVLPLQNLGSAWEIKKEFENAKNYITRSLHIAENYRMKEELARGNLDLAELYFAEKKHENALIAVKIAERTGKELRLPDLLVKTFDIESQLFEQQRQYKSALLYYKKAQKIRDSIFTNEKNKTINELEIKYQTNQRKKDIATLHLQNNLQKKILHQKNLSIIALITAAVLLLFLFGIAYNNFRIKNRANQRIQTLMQELHHRIKNNLSILSGLFEMQIENMSDEKTKNTLLENESRLTSMNLIHNKLYLDNTTTKIEMSSYLGELLIHINDTFGSNKNINLRYEVDNIMVEADKAIAIGLIINELTTNAYKYAFDNFGGEIYLGLMLTEKSKLLLTLSDTGKGIDDTYHVNKLSFGLQLVNLLAKQLNSTLIIKNDKGLTYQMQIGI